MNHRRLGGAEIAEGAGRPPAEVDPTPESTPETPDFGSPPDVALKRQTLLFWDFPKRASEKSKTTSTAL